MFYERFTALCKARGISPSAVTESIGINRTNASFWKKGSMPSSGNLQKLADYFGVPTDYLLGTNDAVSVDVSSKEVIYDTITKAELEREKILLNNLIESIDSLPEKYQHDAIHEIASFAEYTLQKYKTRVPEELLINR